MGALNTFASDTLGVVWRFTGTVDPWTKANQIEDEANALVKASGGTISVEDATKQAQTDVTNAYNYNNADPSAALSGVGKGISDFTHTLVLIGIWVSVAFGLYILFFTPEGSIIRKKIRGAIK